MDVEVYKHCEEYVSRGMSNSIGIWALAYVNMYVAFMDLNECKNM